MPLNADAPELIRKHLEAIAAGERVPLITIGKLTDKQFADLNQRRRWRGLPDIEQNEIIFLGRHAYQRRVEVHGYTIDEVVTQIVSAMAETSVANSSTSIRAVIRRDDGHGKQVRDTAVFECTARRPRLELSSVVPDGDGRYKKNERK